MATTTDSSAGSRARQRRALQLERARHYIERHYDAVVTIDALAAVAHMSRAHFVRQFREAYGETPYRYVLSCRLEKARRRLVAGEVSVADAGLAAGFANRSSFWRLFKARYGVPPAAYREAQPLCASPQSSSKRSSRPQPMR